MEVMPLCLWEYKLDWAVGSLLHNLTWVGGLEASLRISVRFMSNGHFGVKRPFRPFKEVEFEVEVDVGCYIFLN
jgi:hypothetical protein